MAYEALRHYCDRALTCRFVSNVDGTDFFEATHNLDPGETLFILSSKTFTTLETMTNADASRDWSVARLGNDERSVAKHFGRGIDQCGRGREIRHRYRQHVRLLGLGRRALLDGFCDRPFHYAGDRASQLQGPCWMASIRWKLAKGLRMTTSTSFCMGGPTVGPAVAWDLVQTFLASEFSRGERHVRRLNKVASLKLNRRTKEAAG